MDGNGPNGCPRCSVLTQPLAVSYISPWRSFLGIWFCVCFPWEYFAERSPVIYTNSHNLAFFIISTFAWTNNGTSTTSRFFLIATFEYQRVARFITFSQGRQCSGLELWARWRPDEETGGGAEGSMRSMGWVDAGKKYILGWKKYIHYAFLIH